MDPTAGEAKGAEGAAPLSEVRRRCRRRLAAGLPARNGTACWVSSSKYFVLLACAMFCVSVASAATCVQQQAQPACRSCSATAAMHHVLCLP